MKYNSIYNWIIRFCSGVLRIILYRKVIKSFEDEGVKAFEK